VPLRRVVSDQVVDPAGAELPPFDLRGWVRPEESKAKRSALLALREGEDRLFLREVEARAAGLRRVVHACVRLALIRDESERELPVGVERRLLVSCRRD
jgi:hypothetical protein